MQQNSIVKKRGHSTEHYDEKQCIKIQYLELIYKPV